MRGDKAKPVGATMRWIEMCNDGQIAAAECRSLNESHFDKRRQRRWRRRYGQCLARAEIRGHLEE